MAPYSVTRIKAISGRERAVFLETRLERRQGFQRGVGAGAGVVLRRCTPDTKLPPDISGLSAGVSRRGVNRLVRLVAPNQPNPLHAKDLTNMPQGGMGVALQSSENDGT